jgi:hypothetical protein
MEGSSFQSANKGTTFTAAVSPFFPVIVIWCFI